MKRFTAYKQYKNGDTYENSRIVEFFHHWEFILKPEIFVHIIAVNLFLFFLHPQALDSLAPGRLEFSKLFQNRPISSVWGEEYIYIYLRG